ncbi:unnamed protein product [Calicophoron daubneyi]|uniref:RCK N-terminal domain-containing protein n=1 Tax=Calicophoron daubneyi TaxID=300641 RepID=A0AAV2TM54_CALDB
MTVRVKPEEKPISITTHMSELYDLFRCTKQYTGSFNTEYHPRHVVVCGSISYDSVSIFLDAFVNADLGRYDKNIMVVFLSENDPDLRMKALLRRESTNATFLRGDATSQKDLRRAKIRAAEAVIVLGNMKSARPAEDDWENIMRVVSIKNLYPHCRVVCVLTLMENKALMSNIPGWNEDRTGEGDRAICMSQLKLGLMSLNCVSPGISTLLSNLVVSVSVPMGAAKQKKIPRWVRNYFEGTRYRLYSVKLSPTFDQMFFQNLVSIAMKHLHVLVLAVQIFSSIDGTEQIIINPGTRLRINSRQMRAVVLAENFISAQHLRVYCVSCQADRSSHHFEVPFHICRHNSSTPGFSGTECSSEKPYAPPLIKQLFHPFRLHWFNFKQNVLHYQRTKPSPSVCLRRASRKIRPSFKRSIPFATGVQITGVDIMRDTTGLFYWVADREFSSACLSLNDMLDCVLSDHILVCLTKKPGDSRLGLASFVMPLRSTQIPMEELRPIVFLCDSTVVKGEWYSLKNFPQIYILSGSPLSRAFLRAAGVETCFACVVLSCSDELPEKPSLMSDKECILCTLNIRRMIAEAEEQDMDRGPVKQPLVITELSEQKSNTLISVTEEYRSKSGYIPFSPLLAAGNMFVSPLLNDLASTVFFDPAILIFLETVILGGPSQEVEKVFAEDSGFYPGLRGQTITSIPFPGFERRVENRSSNEEQDGSSEASTTNSVFGDNINNCNDGKLKVRFSPDPTQNMIPSKPTSPSSSPVVNPRFTVSKTVINEIPRPPNPLNRHSSLTEESLDTGNDLVKTKTTRQQILENRFTITDPRLERLKQAHSDSWRPLSTNSFLSYTTETGGSVKVRLSRLRLLPLSDLGSTLNRILLQKSETLTFGRMFDLVLHDNGTICIGLYRRVEDGLDEDSDRTEDGIRDMEIEIERYVYTFPKEDTPIFPNDLVYCFTAVTEIREADR